ncbi:MAG: hypothetical protein U0T77_09970 [Chitinophagales bacterium]
MKNYLLILVFYLLSISISFAQTGNVGIGNNAPVAKLDVAGDLALREGTAIAASGNNPAITLTLSSTNPENSFYRITGSPTGAMTINSIANGVDGQMITIVNATTIKLKISNNNVANGILTSGGATTVIAPNGSFTLQYSSTAGRWYVTNASGATVTDWTKAATSDEPAVNTDDQYVTGKVGIGDFSGAAPVGMLHIKNNQGGSLLGIAAANNIVGLLEHTSGAAGANTRFILGNNNTIGGGNGGNQIEFWHNSFGGGQGYSANILNGGTQGTSAGFTNGYLTFGTSNNANTPSERVRITSTGLVGINTTTPAAKLDIQAGADNTGTNDPFAMAFQYRTGGYRHWLSTRHNGAVSSNQNAIDIYLNNSTTAAGSSAPTTGTLHGMSITATGVGIGTTNPLTKLHIQANNNNDAAISFTSNGTGTPTQTRIRTVDNNWSGDMLFETSVPGSGSGAVTERMRMKNNGDLQMTGSQGNLWMETNGWADPGTTGAGIAVDNNGYKSLMIVGNNVAGNLGQNRQVQVWDYMRVNGYLTVGTQANATATNPPAGTLRYNTTRQCMEYWNGTYWICMGAPTVQRVTVRDQNDENYQGTGCNSCSGWGGSYGNIYTFTVNNLYAGQKIMFYAEVMFDNDTKKNSGYSNATKIYGNGYFGEIEVVVPGGWETVQTKVFPAQTITSTGNLTFSFESNTGITDVRITAVAY